MDPYWILHFLAFLAFWVREHCNVYKLAQKRILFPHGAWQPNNTKRKKHMFLVFPHFSQRTFKSQQILIHIFRFETQRKTWPYDITTTGHTFENQPWKQAQRHGTRKKKHLSDNYPTNFVEFRWLFGCTEKPSPFHLSPNERIPHGRSVQLNGLKASMPYSRYAAHC